MRVELFTDGAAILGDCTSPEVIDAARIICGKVGLIVADPPYGNVVSEKWDRTSDSDAVFSDWMIKWTRAYCDALLCPGGAFYVWGGIGTPGFRPFMRYLCEVEQPGKLELANLITWKKRRAYGVQHNYLFTREECAYFTKGPAKKPRVFHVPLLDEKRGYAGYNAKYPAKSEFYRRSNVWTDINEMFRGKVHPTQKPQALHRIMIETHTDPGDWIVDPFAGSFVTAFAARALGRNFVMIEKDEGYFNASVDALRVDETKKVIG